MFGFVHRLHVEHIDDNENPLIYLKLCFPYAKTGIFKAGKSYMIRSKTESVCYSKFNELRCLENLIPDLSDPKPFNITYGSYLMEGHKEIYSLALSHYISTLTKLDRAFYYITDIDKQIIYLEDRLCQLKPDWRAILWSQTVYGL